MEKKVFTREDDISYLEMYNIETGEVELIKKFNHLIEAPNFTPDGKFVYFNTKGRIHKYEMATGIETEIDTGDVKQCNNDHVISPDGTLLAISSRSQNEGSKVYVLPVDGGTPRQVTPLFPSFLHGWSVDGKTLAFTAYRPSGRNICIIPTEGGDEVNLTTGEFLNDGSEYAPNGKHIWFNSVRTGLMQAWRMNVDGTEQTQMTFDEDKNTWFPHISPDGRTVVMIAYKAGDVEPSDHPVHKDVELRIMSAEGGEVKKIAEFFGGQGSFNVNSWTPCSKKFAYVRYELPCEE